MDTEGTRNFIYGFLRTLSRSMTSVMADIKPKYPSNRSNECLTLDELFYSGQVARS